jgi:hypothetical protein
MPFALCRHARIVPSHDCKNIYIGLHALTLKLLQIAGLGYKSWQAQLLTVPPFAVGSHSPVLLSQILKHFPRLRTV